MAKTVSLVVARADILGHIEIHPEAPDLIEIERGSRLQVKLMFKYVEMSNKKDDFELHLESEFAGSTPEPAKHSHKDRRGLFDDQQGFIMQEYTIPNEPGQHLLTYMATAKFTHDGQSEKSSAQGQIMVTVT